MFINIYQVTVNLVHNMYGTVFHGTHFALLTITKIELLVLDKDFSRVRCGHARRKCAFLQTVVNPTFPEKGLQIATCFAILRSVPFADLLGHITSSTPQAVVV
ncbi:hypothetical protein OUZ56_020782 [Daphnia magna]|uniref:Uncharacterized protein n=1 Tax=Daphnia magna TaxID=35525 RepID=A0ABQ9ZGI4_9CRUS|nr:hypothetical protein OUZ56_020782 [Daphnia magna]